MIVEFPEEKEDSETPTSIISNKCIFEKDGVSYCWWPSYLKSESSKHRAVANHLSLKIEDCPECPIVIKYSTGNNNRNNFISIF